MVQPIELNNIQPINFSEVDNFVPETQRLREEELQSRAGLELSTDYKGVRTQIAQDIRDEEIEESLSASEMALKSGANPQVVSDFLKAFEPNIDPEVSLEMLAGRREAEDALTLNPTVFENNFADGTDPGKSMSKLEILSNFVTRVRTGNSPQSAFNTFGEVTRVFVDPNVNQIRVMQNWLPEELRQERVWTSVGMGKLLMNHIQKLWDNLDEKQFAEALQQLGDHILAEERNTLMLNDMMDYFEHGGLTFMDMLSWSEAASVGSSIAKSSLKMLSKSGNIEKLAQEAAEVVAKSTSKTEVAKEIITPTATKAVPNPTEISPALAVTETVGEAVAEQTAKDFVSSRMVSGLYKQSELDLVKDIIKEKTMKPFKKSSVTPRDVMLIEQEDGAVKLSMLIGGAEGRAVTAKRADSIAKRLGLNKEEWQLVKKDSEGFFVQVDKDVSNTTRVLLGKEMTKSTDKTAKEWSITGTGFFNAPLNWLTKHFSGLAKIGQDARARAVEAERVLQGITTELNRTYRVSFNKLSKEGKEELNSLIAEGLQGKGKWFTKDELDAKKLSEDVQKAYWDYKRVSDIEFYANNNNVRKNLVRKGYKMFGEYIGKEEKLGSVSLSKAIIKDLNGDIVTDLSKYNDKDHVLVKVSKGYLIRQGEVEYTHIIAPRSQLIGKELPAIVTNYMPGGRRQYMRGTMFVKIGTGYFNPATKNVLNGFAKTLIAGSDREALQAYADEVNRLIEIYKESRGIAKRAIPLLDAEDFQYLKVDSWEQVKELIKSKKNPKGVIDTRYRAQVLENKQKYDFGNTFENVFDDVTDEDEAVQDLINLVAGMGRKRGNILEDINGGTVKLVDIDELYDNTIRKAAYTMAKGELTQWYSSELNKFSKVIENWKDIEGMSDLQKITQARVMEEGRAVLKEEDKQLVRAAERYLDFARRTLNARTKWDVKLENAMTSTAKIVDCWLPESYRRGKAFEKISKLDPAKVGRAMGFNFYMGWWNIAQLTKQGLGIEHVLAAEPINGAKAFLLYPFVRLARGSQKSSRPLYNFFKKAAMKAAGITDEDFEGIIKFTNRYGSESSAGLLVGADRVYGEALRADTKLLNKVWDSQYMFMNAGNAANFYMADIAAFLSKKGEGLREVAAYADAISLIPSKATQSAFQAGQYLPTTILAQWKSYPTRVIDSMFDKELSKAQKLRIVMAHLMTWGIGGTFLNDKNQLNMYTGLVEAGADPVIADVFVSGAIGAAGHLEGVEMDEGLNLQSTIGDLVDIYDADEGKFQMPAVPAAQAVPQMLAMFNAIKELVAPTTGDYDTWRYMKYLATHKNLPSSIRNLAKGAMALKFQKFYDNHGRTLTDDATTIQAVAQMLGFGPFEGKQNSYIYEALTQREETLKEFLEQIEPIADAIHDNREEMDVEKRNEVRERLYQEYRTVSNGIEEIIKEIAPEGDMLSDFRRRKLNLLFKKRETTIDKNTKKLIREIGENEAYMVLRQSEEIRNHGTIGE